MTHLNRRAFGLGILGTAALAGCGNGIGSPGANKIDARVGQTLSFMEARYPATVDLGQNAAGMLVMPLVTEAGLGLGGSYGRGALQLEGATVDYYSATSASAGLQIGAQQYAHVLFFMTDQALRDFRRARGWAAGADVEYAWLDRAANARAETTTTLAPVVAAIFNQAGFRAGASLEGTKYTRIIP
ncbi:MAG: lipid-binding SYLF domain-containing protein [Shimia sp.]